jgi:hypothetical protein
MIVASTVNVVVPVCVALFASVTAPLIVVYLTARQRHREKQQDYDRQDEVARRAEDVARAAQGVAKQAAEAATLLVDSNERVAVAAREQAKVTNGKLDAIHTLVNSNMSAAMQSELDATVRDLAMMREVIALRATAGREPTAEILSAVSATEDRIAELRAVLADRAQQTEIADAQIER